jgi:hypothetical protein
MKKFDELDCQCEKIFNVIAVNPEPLTFNRLFKLLQTEMTKPTLINHLNHLQKHKIITRKKIGKQKVTYTMSDGLSDELKNEREFIKGMEELKKQTDVLDSFSLRNKMQYVLLLTTIIEVDKIKNSLQLFLAPKERFKAELKYAFARYELRTLTEYILRSIVIKSATDVAEALRVIDEIEKNFIAKASLKGDVRDVFEEITPPQTSETSSESRTPKLKARNPQ